MFQMKEEHVKRHCSTKGTGDKDQGGRSADSPRSWPDFSGKELDFTLSERGQTCFTFVQRSFSLFPGD